MMVKCSAFISLFCAFAFPSSGVAQNRELVHSFRFQEVELRVVLDSLIRWYTVPLVYLDKDVEGRTVTAECNGCNFEEALIKVIAKQDLVARFLGEQVLLQKQSAEPVILASTLAGTVTDSSTGEWIADASVLLQTTDDEGAATTYRWCSTNDFGFFSLQKIQPGSYTLVVRSVGYRPRVEHLAVEPGSSSLRDLTLSTQEYMLPEITIEGQRSALAASEGISRGVYIRATPTDQNQYFLEGARIYNPSHFGGVLNTFNGDALRDVQKLAGGVPPYYGGRIGGILDVTLRNGTGERLSGAAGVGSFSSNLVLEGPVAEGTTFLISGRQGYPDILLPRLQPTGTPSDLHSSEVMAKVSHVLAGSSRLSLSGYVGRDAYNRDVQSGAGAQLANSLHWGNAAANLRWIGVVSPSLFVHASGVYTRYSFDVEHRLSSIAFAETFRSDYSIDDAALRAHAEYFYDEHHTVRGGVELVHHGVAGTISEFSSQLAPLSLRRLSLWELSVYFQDQWQLIPSVSAELGARATSFIGTQWTFSAIDPRFALLVSLDDDLRLYSSLTSVNQFLHPYRNSGIFLFYPTIFYYPSTEKERPSTSLQVSVGIEKHSREGEYTLSVESYYRVTQKLHEFVFDTVQSSASDLSDAVLLGEGTTYGAELTISKRRGDLTGTMRYSLSWVRNRFAEINGGQPYRPWSDRRHELYIAASYTPMENWTLGALCLVASNDFPPFSSGVSKSLEANIVRTPGISELSRSSDAIDLNGSRLPGFQRLEFHVSHRFSWWGFPVQATLRLLNGYGLLDPFVWELRENPDTRLRWRVTFDGPGLFPLYPVANVSVGF